MIRLRIPLLFAFLAATGCDRGSPAAPPDTDSPLIEVVFPVESFLFDRDGDGLVDIEVRFLDSLSGVDVSSVRLISDREVKGPAGARTDLLAVWRVERSDSSGFVVEEHPDFLLPRGRVELTIQVTDREGNVATRTLEVHLPVAALHRVIDLQALLILTTNILLSPDGRRLYVTTEEPTGSSISIVDPWTLEWLKTVRVPIRGFSRMAYDPGRHRIYTMSIDHPLLGVFDVATETFLPSIPTTARGIGVAYSARRDEVYVGLEVESGNPNVSTALVSVVDPARGEEVRVVDLGVLNVGNPGTQMSMGTLLLDPAEERLYIATGTFAQAGVLVMDPASGELLDQFDLKPEDPISLGGAQDVELDGERLVSTGSDGRIGITPLADPDNPAFIPLGVRRPPGAIAVAPDRSAWLTETGDGGVGFIAVLLIDALSRQIIYEHQISQPSDSRDDVAFRSDGNLFFTVSGLAKTLDFGPSPNQLTVYLHR